MNWVSAVLEVCHAGVLSRCPTATYGIGTKEGKSWDTHLVFPPKFSPTFSSVFSRCLRFPMFFNTFSPAFHPFFHRCSPTFPPWNSPFQGRSRGETSPAQRWFHGCVSGYTTRSRESHAVCSERIRKARNLWCGTFWIGHDWSLKVWMDSIQVVWYEWTFWMDMISLVYIYNSKFGTAKRNLRASGGGRKVV